MRGAFCRRARSRTSQGPSFPRGVNAGDIGAIKAHLGQSVSLTTYRYDVNASGAIDAQDVSMVKTRAGWVLP